MLTPVLLCGGSGTRLWPLSRSHYPKQFLPLAGERSLLQESALRIAALADAGPLVAVANSHHRFLVAEQLQETGVEVGATVLEPAARNTAPAVAAAAMAALEADPEAVLLVAPSDHLVRDVEAFHAAVARGLPHARDGQLVTFGIIPDCPETGYGYIRSGTPLADGVQVVEAFVEKPDAATAAAYLADGGYHWNSGIFLFGAQRYLEELAAYRPDILEAVERAWAERQQDLDFVRLEEGAFGGCPAESIDYAVMERTTAAAVVPLECGWSDLGSWGSLHEVGERCGETGNVLVGDVLAEDTFDSYIHSEGRLIAAVGVRDQVIVETADAILVAARDRVQDVKRIVSRLEAHGRDEATIHRRVNRPWGAYEGVASAERFQVKRITVKPGARLSVQMHHHRAEHWVVVKGTARVTRGEETFLLKEDQSTYIPLGVTHCLENPGVIPLEVVEVQTGSYLGEDDIVRVEDRYGRC
ncbi:mannose-1-phosphate guanylyltransferase/mannose-6-phosphate isomerase [Arhodomonas sp. SL1]|uniref:mannose-1-phosphate guanylyltransferase/mannose-6-phosphate isomerase n=1 Tax=Arhodomonas sp. SL1 TaxID=3425691 RepID=UPI003F88564D